MYTNHWPGNIVIIYDTLIFHRGVSAHGFDLPVGTLMLPGIPQGFQSGPSFPSIISPSDSSAFRIHVWAHPKYRSQACQHNQLLGYRFRCYTNIYICIYISPSQLFQTRRSRVSCAYRSSVAGGGILGVVFIFYHCNSFREIQISPTLRILIAWRICYVKNHLWKAFARLLCRPRWSFRVNVVLISHLERSDFCLREW